MFNVIEYNCVTNEEMYIHTKVETSEEAKRLRDRQRQQNILDGVEERMVFVQDDKGNVWH